jgi:oxalate---CoA ligase
MQLDSLKGKPAPSTAGAFEPKTLWQLIQGRAAGSSAHNTALRAPDCAGLTYEQLLSQIDLVGRAFRSAGIHRQDRVAVVLPTGPTLAAAFLATTANAVCAPLNPAYRESEFDFYLGDLRAKALIVEKGSDSAALKVARARDIRIIELSPSPTAAGAFQLGDSAGGPTAPDSPSSENDVALVLHTSGTTARPKLVLLAQRNLIASANHISETLQLTDSDRCLNIMPLFHIHGLMAAVLASLRSGGSVYCSPGYNSTGFYRWLDDANPSWYTAVPTMHQSILEGAAAEQAVIDRCKLRFIRSSSSPLPPAVMLRLETTFRVPVIEAYGMTEAAHQVASNPLPPGKRVPGSVGKAAGPEVTILDEKGNVLPAGSTGEVSISGPNITAGYESNDVANDNAFINGWFRTGDQGYLSPDGYLFLTGRTKEIINRGGEKISPREVDDALLLHHAIAQAVTFAVPHSTLGEAVAAAVVFRAGMSASTDEIRTFLSRTLADFKIPSQVVVLDDLPKGSTGKLQRIGLADKLASRLRADFVAPTTEVQRALAKIWVQVLKVPEVSINDNFFALGGDSLKALVVSAEAKKQGYDAENIFLRPTIAALTNAQTEAPSLVATIYDSNQGATPLYLLPPGWGNAFAYLPLRAFLENRRATVYGLMHPWLVGMATQSAKEEHEAYAEAILQASQGRPIILGGWSRGANELFVTASLLKAKGAHIEKVLFLDFEPNTHPIEKIKSRMFMALRLIGALARHSAFVSRVLQWLAPSAQYRMELCVPNFDHVPTVEEMKRSLGGARIVDSEKLQGLSEEEITSSFLEALHLENIGDFFQHLSPKDRILSWAVGYRPFKAYEPKVRLELPAYCFGRSGADAVPRVHHERFSGRIRQREYPFEERNGMSAHASVMHPDNIRLFFDDFFAALTASENEQTPKPNE